MNVPKLRFKEFTDEWNIHKLKDLCTTCGGGTPSKSITEYWTGNIPWISSSDLESNSIFKINISKFITTKAISESATKIIPPNSILIVSRVGVGKVAINYNELCTSQDFTNLINIKSNPIFLTYLLKIKMEKQIQQTQGTSIKGITTNDIKNINCTLPNIKEQEKIANFLTTVDKKITNLENTITSLENQKKGLLQQIFSQKLRFKDKNGNNYPNWEKKKLGELIIIKTGISPTHILDENGSIPYFKVEQLNNSNKYQINTPYKTKNNKKLIPPKSIIFPKRGISILSNKIRILSQYSLIDTNIMALIIKNDSISNEFLYYFLLNEDLSKIADTTSIPQINNKHIEPYVIYLPCLEEQTKIANFLSAFDRKLENQKAQLEHWKQIKKGLLQQMFV